jgi:hypothetical protein
LEESVEDVMTNDSFDHSGYVFEETGQMAKYVIAYEQPVYQYGNGFDDPALCKAAGLEPGKIYDSMKEAGEAIQKIWKVKRLRLTVRVYREPPEPLAA